MNISNLDYLSIVVYAAIGVPVAALVTLSARVLWLVVSGIITSVFSELPILKGTWTATFDEPDKSGNLSTASEEIKLRQFGRLVWGKSRGLDGLSRHFKYKGEIRKNILVGTYKRIGSRKAAGRGAFQLLIRGNEITMEGKCVWYDHDTDAIESSAYIWEKQ